MDLPMECKEMAQVLNSYLEKSIADLALLAGLDPIDLLINGFPLSICQEANARLAVALGELRTDGIIRDYSLTAMPRGDKMTIEIYIDLSSHLESSEVTMAAGEI
ncbi:MAG: hypothetical protein PHD57_06830 [Desulfobacterales bacterium]|nr:hypothetical protein [Desulfobacterales bacterium]